MAKIRKRVRGHLEKAVSSAVAAVETYNRPGRGFRTRTYVVLMTIAWTALFHAIFFKRGIKPWYTKRQGGKGTRYVKVEGDVKHWELQECVNRFYGPSNPPERSNLSFLIKLRNKIEHREHPELDPALYGECQASLMNFEDLMLSEFGTEYSLAESLVLALQFSALRSNEQERAVKKLQASALRDILDFIQEFRAGLPVDVLDSSRYSLKVFLIPKLANRQSAADLAVEFVPFDASKPAEMEELEKVTALIREKRVPVVSSDLLKASQVVKRLKQVVPFKITEHTHICAWRHYKVRPPGGSANPEKTNSDYCVYDHLMAGYGYTQKWVEFLSEKLRNPAEFERVTGKSPTPLNSQK